MANPGHVHMLQLGAEQLNVWRASNPGLRPDLRRADLRNATLAHYNLSEIEAKGINLNRANLYRSDLSRAVLHPANLIGTVINQCIVEGAVLTKARCGGTIFADIDLSSVDGLNAVVHRRPSTVGIDTIAKSLGRVPVSFLRGVGLSNEAIEVVGRIGTARQYHSAFVSYSHSDHDFANVLYKHLQGRGIRCWLEIHWLVS